MPPKAVDLSGLNHTLVRAGERVCVALSGGADSVALLLALHELNGRREGLGIVLSAIHVHHGLRGEAADGDEAFVRTLCARVAVPLGVVHVNTAARQIAEQEGLEEAARALRYTTFADLLAKGQADAIATAHTLNDQAETVLLKLVRGAWTEGLGGISPVLVMPSAGNSSGERTPGTGRVVRPLLSVRRAQVEAFLNARSQPWREDASNADVRLTRNRVRHELLPALRTFNPGIDDLLAQTADIARDEEDFWKAEVARVLPQLLLQGLPVRGGGRAVGTQPGERTYSVDLARLKVLPTALQRRVLRATARQIGARLTGEETARLMALAGLGVHATVSARIGARLELRDGLRAERSARELRLWGRFGAIEGDLGESSGRGS